jgi:MFS family permease
VIPFAVAAGRFAARRGHRGLLVVGGLTFAVGGALLAFGLPPTPAYLTRFLPAAIITGIGIGLVMPSLTGAAVHGLPEDRFALGAALNQAFRQIAAALGVALTLALLAMAPGPRGFTHAFVLVMLGGLATALLALPIDTRPRAQATRREADNVHLV